MKKVLFLFLTATLFCTANFISCSAEGGTEIITQAATPPVVSGITIIQKPAKTAYQVNSPVSFSGLIVGASYDNGITGIIYDYTTNPEDGASFSEAGTHSVTVSYGSYTATFDVTVVEQLVGDDVYLESLSVFQKPTKSIYEQNQTLDLSGLIVLGQYSNGVNSLFLDYTTDPENGTVLDELGKKTVKINRGELSTEFTVTVVEKIVYGDLSEISVTVAEESDISIQQEEIEGGIKLSCDGDFESYSWKVNNTLVGVEKEFTLNTTELITGNYEIFLKVKDSNGSYKSATIYIQVE